MIYKCDCGKAHDNGIHRRDFLGLSAGAVFGYALTKFAHPMEVAAQSGFPTRNTAEFCILINMNGGPSHCDLFDAKTNGPSRIRPDNWETEMAIQDVPSTNFKLPFGLLPELVPHADKMIPARWYSWSNGVHEFGQYWNYTGMDVNPAFQGERPNIGAVVASEFARTRRRRTDDILPGFVSLSGLPIQNGFLSGEFAPFVVGANPGGLGGLLQHYEGGSNPTRFEQDRWPLLQRLDSANRGANPPLGKAAEDMTSFYNTTRRMMYNPIVENAFRFSLEDARRFSPRADLTPNGTGFGNACIVARNLVRANNGTRFVWITTGGWDMHENIYQLSFGMTGSTINNNGTARQFSAGLGALLNDLRSEPSVRAPEDPNRSLLDDTLIVINGDFGRTPANQYTAIGTGLNSTAGRDHWGRAGDIVFIGGGIRGGRALGATDQFGDNILADNPGWDAFAAPRTRRSRSTGSYPNAGPWIRTEDAYFSMYSALGIDPTVRYTGTPSGRPYEIMYRGTEIFGELPLW